MSGRTNASASELVRNFEKLVDALRQNVAMLAGLVTQMQVRQSTHNHMSSELLAQEQALLLRVLPPTEIVE